MNRKVGVLLSYVMMVFEVLSTLLLTPFIIRTLGQAEFGVYKLSAAVTAYLMLLDLGVGNAIIRYIAKYRAECNKEKERQFFGISLIFYFAIGLLSLLLGMTLIRVFPVFFSKGLTADEISLSQKLLFFTTLDCTVTLSTTCFRNIILAYEKFAVSRLCSIVQIVLKICAVYIMLRMGFGSLGIVCVQLVLTILLQLFLAVYVLHHMKLYPSFQNISSDFIKEIVTYCGLIFIQMIATQLNASLDQVLLGRFVASSAVIIAIYGVGTQIVQYFQQIGTAFTSVLMPGIVKMVSGGVSPERLSGEMVRIGRLIFMLLSLIWVCFVLNGREFIVLWAGEENKDAYFVTAILMFAYIFILTESIGTQILWALNQHKEQSWLKIAVVLLNIFLTILLIRWNPLIGATLGTFLSLLLGDIGVMNVIFKRKLGMNIGRYYKDLFRGILPCLAGAFAVGLLVNGVLPGTWLGLVLRVGLMAAVYCGLIWLHGFNTYEKNLAQSMMNRLKKKSIC